MNLETEIMEGDFMKEKRNKKKCRDNINCVGCNDNCSVDFVTALVLAC
jgi:hypothetical protein